MCPLAGRLWKDTTVGTAQRSRSLAHSRGNFNRFVNVFSIEDTLFQPPGLVHQRLGFRFAGLKTPIQDKICAMGSEFRRGSSRADLRPLV